MACSTAAMPPSRGKPWSCLTTPMLLLAAQPRTQAVTTSSTICSLALTPSANLISLLILLMGKPLRVQSAMVAHRVRPRLLLFSPAKLPVLHCHLIRNHLVTTSLKSRTTAALAALYSLITTAMAWSMAPITASVVKPSTSRARMSMATL